MNVCFGKPNSLTLYLSRHSDVVCSIKQQMRRLEEESGDASDTDDSLEDPVRGRAYTTLCAQLKRERTHQRNLQPQLRWEGYWHTNGEVELDPNSVVCMI